MRIRGSISDHVHNFNKRLIIVVIILESKSVEENLDMKPDNPDDAFIGWAQNW